MISPKKSLRQRQAELQSLIATPAGREELRRLGERCHAASGRVRPAGASVIAYILVYERDRDLIAG